MRHNAGQPAQQNEPFSGRRRVISGMRVFKKQKNIKNI